MNNIILPDKVKEILDKFKSKKYQIYVVGGAIRDMILGRPTYDWDFTTNATPNEILQVLPDGFYDNIYGTVGLIVEDFEKPFEITTFRTERGYSDSRRPDSVAWGKTLEEDLLRRDFTINALAYDGSKVIDLYQGLKDIDRKIIRAVGNADERFREDALRKLRAVRKAGELGFEKE